MKLFFISDIHGSVYYLKKALEKFKEEKADYIVILGDELYHGARNPLPQEYDPKTASELLNELSGKIIAVRGNCDSEVDEMVIDYPIMSTYSTILYNSRRIFLTHGHVYGEHNMPKLGDGDVFIYGHTHIPVAEKRDNIYVLNPGSITFPKGGYENSYGVLAEDVFYIKNFNGNVIKQVEFE